MNYKRLCEIDLQIERLKDNLSSINRSYKVEVTFVLREGTYNTRRETYISPLLYKDIRKYIKGGINNYIAILKKEKGMLLNKKWYQFWL